ncbi:MAG: ATP-binding cassette domain-containing protein [Gammaproteobacteria bacterium]|nr:MAG: ATP-binding cassette domain-containing protein [Gammaproteobacteria bacterium]
MQGLLIETVRCANIGPINLTIEPEQCIGLSGDSGSGKTRLLRTIADLDPHEGLISVNNTEQSAIPGSQWRTWVGLLSSEIAWWYESVGMHFMRWPAELIESVGFSQSIKDQEVARLSSGEKQRLGFARLLALQPTVLLLDEPTANLDRQNRARIESIVHEYQLLGASVLWVSHDPNQIRRVCSKHVRLNQGQLEVIDTVPARSD